MAKQYKVVVFGGIDGLKFPELPIKFSNGVSAPLYVKKGQYLPLDILDPLDVKKSLIAGSLGRAIKAGMVVVEDDTPVPPPPTPVVQPPKPVVAPEVVASEPKPVPEEPKPLSYKQAIVEASKEAAGPITDLSSVKSYEDFCRLSYFLKLRFVKDCTDKNLLKTIGDKADSNQIKNNINIRLASM